MLTDFITIYENALSNEYCENWIDYINNLREQGLCINETTKTHERDHEVINFANDDSFDLNCFKNPLWLSNVTYFNSERVGWRMTFYDFETLDLKIGKCGEFLPKIKECNQLWICR